MSDNEAVASAQDLKQKVLRGFAWEATSKLVIQVVSWASTLLVARMLSPDDYGIVAIAFLFTQLAENIVDMGMGESLIMKRKTTVEQEDGVFYLSLGFGVFLFILLFVGAEYIGRFYNDERLVDLVRILGFNAVLASVRIVPFGLLMQRMDFRYRAWVEMIGQFLTSAASLALAYLGFGFWTLVAASLLSQVVLSLGYLPVLKRIPRPRFRLSEVMPFFGYGLRITGNNALFYFYERSPSFVSGKLLGAEATGHLTMATSLAAMPINKIGTMFNRVGFTTFAQMRDDRDAARNYFLKMHRYLLILVYPVLFGMAIVAHDLIEILLTAKWSVAASVLQVLCAWNLFVVSAMIPQYGLLYGLGRVDLAFRYHVANLFLLPLGCLIGGQWGLIPMSWGMAIGYLPAYVLLMAYALREVRGTVGDLLMSIAPGLAGSLFMGGVLLAVRSQMMDASAVERLVVCTLVGMLAYAAFLYFGYRRGIEEVREGFAVLRG